MRLLRLPQAISIQCTLHTTLDLPAPIIQYFSRGLVSWSEAPNNPTWHGCFRLFISVGKPKIPPPKWLDMHTSAPGATANARGSIPHRLLSRGCTHDTYLIRAHPPQAPAADAGGKKARKRQREGDEEAAAAASAAAPSKKGKGVGGATSTQEEEEEEEEEGEGDQQLVKTGFFSAVKFSSLPLSAGMLTALAELNFSTTTKIQASCCHPRRLVHIFS